MKIVATKRWQLVTDTIKSFHGDKTLIGEQLNTTEHIEKMVDMFSRVLISAVFLVFADN